MSKFIIENRTELPTETVLFLVQKVMDNGRICADNTQFVYVTTFIIKSETFAVSTFKNKNSDRFVITKDSK